MRTMRHNAAILAAFLLSAAAAASPSRGAPTSSSSAILTPWCANSMRIRVTPTATTPAVAAARASLAAALAAKKMTDLAGAMTDATCTPGAPVVAASGSTTTQNNLAVHTAADGTLSFTRVDTGALLFAAKASFALNTGSGAGVGGGSGSGSGGGAGRDESKGTDLGKDGKLAGYFAVTLDVTAGDQDEVVYGLGQGNWTDEGGCPAKVGGEAE